MSKWALPATFILTSILYLYLFVYTSFTGMTSITLSMSEATTIMISACAYGGLGLPGHLSKHYASLTYTAGTGLLLGLGLATLVFTEENVVLNIVSGSVLVLIGIYRSYAALVNLGHLQESKEQP